MWIAKNINKSVEDGQNGLAGIVRAGADRRVSASADNGISDYSIVNPSGILSVPNSSDDAVVISTASGQMCIGVRGSYYGFYPEPGEIIIYNSKGSKIWLKNDGTIQVDGNIEITGKVTINGEEV